MASQNGGIPNIYAYRGRQLLSQYIARHKDIPNHTLSELRDALRKRAPTAELPVCIIGAGAAGLYTAMIFESLGISYQIVDADTRERVGGRIFTYRFPNGGPYDYYDVGAMRFPDSPFMKRLFDLARNRNLPVKLIPYVMQMVKPSPNTFLFYNNARVNNQDNNVTGDPFSVRGYIKDPNLAAPQDVSRKVSEVLEPFRALFRGSQDIAIAMKTLFQLTNRFSMRSYMSEILCMDAQDISWCETLENSTGGFDRALTEEVIDSLAFDWPLPDQQPQNSDPNESWHCFDKGSSTLPQAMFESLSQDAQKATQFKSPVTAISLDPQNRHMNISINGTKSTQSYCAVISTVPLPRLSLMDLTGVNINSNYGQWSAIRALQYGPAIKVGIKFSCPWWETQLSIHGGQSYTDLPLRMIVYPSYPQGATPENMSKVLIVSYCWTQDAERVGALINRDGTGTPELIDLVFRDLAAVHGVTVDWLRQYYTPGDYFAWDYLRDPLTMGAFALFGPGVYGSGDVYDEMLRPAAGGKLFFAGEATSSCHAWVSGALDSAWRAVDQYLALNRPLHLRQEFWKKWGPTEYWDQDFDEKLADLDHELMERHLAIDLHEPLFA